MTARQARETGSHGAMGERLALRFLGLRRIWALAVLAALAGVAVLALVVRTPRGIDELEAWDGRSEVRIRREMGMPGAVIMYATPPAGIGVSMGVARKLKVAAPAHAGQVKHLHWTKGSYCYDCFLYQNGGNWLVIDALKYHKDIQF